MNSAYHDIIDRFKHRKVLVIGDIILDTYLQGFSARLSHDVPVVEISDSSMVLGGAANIAVNFKALGADVTFVSAVGDDEAGNKTVLLLAGLGFDTQYVLRESERQTTVKTRVMSHSQVLARFDYGSREAIGGKVEQQIISILQESFRRFDVIMIGDYYGGIFTDRIINTLAELKKRNRGLFAVDSKDLSRFRILRPTLVKPNYHEGLKLLRLSEQGKDRGVQMAQYGKELYEITASKIIALTLDAEGAVIFEQGEFRYRSYAHKLPGANVVGAGDTFISAFSLALFNAADIPLSTEIATAAAGIAVSKEGTAPCAYNELRSFFSIHNKYVLHTNELKKLAEIYEAQGKRIVFTNGCFDILHSGHVSYLNRAKELGDVLIVGLNCDDSIRRLKGAGRPINPLEDRMEVLSALTAIDHIVPFVEDSPVDLIKAVSPHIYAKGGDYSKNTLPEAGLIEQLGGKIVFVPLIPDHSTTGIISRINNNKFLKLA